MINGRKSLKKKLLAITADDYGPHPFINRGILSAIKASRITSVGVLTNNYSSPNTVHYHFDLRQEVEKLITAIQDKERETNTPVGIGVHLSLTSGAPLTDNAALIHYKNIDRFQDIREFKFGTYKTHLEAVGSEIEAQIRALKNILDDYNIPVDHISCHQGLIYLFSHYNEELIKAVQRIYPAAEYSKEQKPVLRTTYPIGKMNTYKKTFYSNMLDEGKNRAYRLIDDNFGNLINLLLSTTYKSMKAASERYTQSGFQTTNYFFDNFYEKPSENEVKTILKKFPEPYSLNRGEMVVHLGDPEGFYEQVELHGINRLYFPKRKKELATLLQIELAKMAHQNGVELVEMRAMHQS